METSRLLSLSLCDVIALGIDTTSLPASDLLASLAVDGSGLSQKIRSTLPDLKRDEPAVVDELKLDEPAIDNSGLDHKYGHIVVHPADDIKQPMDPDQDRHDIEPEVVAESSRKRPMRLLIDDSSSDASDGLRYNGDKAFYIREIMDERTVDGLTDFFVTWDGYSTSEASWIPAENVNQAARQAWKKKKKS